MEHQPLGLVEDRHRVGDVVQGLVVRLDVALQESRAGLLGSVTSSVQTPTPPPSSGWAVTWKARRRPATVAQRTASRRWPRLAASLARASAARVEGDAAGGGLVQAGGVRRPSARRALTQTGEPSAAAIQAGLGRASRKAAKRGGGGQAGVLAGRRREPQPGQGAGRAALDRHQRRLRPADLEGAGLAALEQGAQAPRMVGVGAHQGVDHAPAGRRRPGPAPRRRPPGSPRRRPAGRGRPRPPAGRSRRPRPRPGRPRRGPRRRPAARVRPSTRSCACRRWASAHSTAQMASETAPAAAARIRSSEVIGPAFAALRIIASEAYRRLCRADRSAMSAAPALPAACLGDRPRHRPRPGPQRWTISPPWPTAAFRPCPTASASWPAT